MKKLEDIEKIDLNVWLPSGKDSIYLYQKLISTSALRDIMIDSMYMSTCLVYDTEFVNCQFRNSTFYESEFRSCKFTNCLFEKCRHKEQDFSRCTIDETRFEGCDLFQAYFYKSVLNSTFFTQSKSDLTTFKNCTIDGITVTDVTFAPLPPAAKKKLELDRSDTTYLESYVLEADHESLRKNRKTD